MVYLGKHHSHLMQKSTQPVINIVSLTAFQTSVRSSFVQLGLVIFIFWFSPNCSALFKPMDNGQIVYFSLNTETFWGPTIYYQRPNRVQRLSCQDWFFLSYADCEVWLLWSDFAVFYRHAVRCQFAAFKLNPEFFSEIAASLRSPIMAHTRYLLKEIFNKTLN